MRTKPGRPFGTFKGIHPTRINGKATKAYSCYQAMIQRCGNPNAHNWKDYGGRGISVCERWQASYDNFVSDMGIPLPGYSIERKDNSLGYSPDNCVWATQKEQCGNRRSKPTNPNSLFGKAKLAGLSYMLVYLRIKKNGWTEERALSTPVQPRGRQLGFKPVRRDDYRRA